MLTQTVPARTAGRPGRRAPRSRCRRSPTGRRRSSWRGDRLLLVGEGLERQHRPEHLALDDLGVVGARLDQRRLVEQRPPPARAAAADDRSPFARARSTNPSTRARWSGWMSGEIGRPVVARIAQHVRVDVAVEALQEVVARPTPRRAAGCRPGRPGRRRRTGRRPCGGRGSRSASANTISGPLPPSSAVNGTRLRGRRDADQAARLGRAGEATRGAGRDGRRARRRPPRRCPGRR